MRVTPQHFSSNVLPLLFGFILLGSLLGHAAAQTCDAYVSVDGALLDGEAACYFGPGRGPEQAYIRTDKLTAALALESDYLPESSTLRFTKGPLTLELPATDEVAAALTPRAGVLRVQDANRKGRSAILAADGFSYLPLLEVTRALGGSVSYNETASLVSVGFSAAPRLPATPAPPRTPSRTPPRTPQSELGEPRYALHDGYTRVAIDVPAGATYQLAVDGQNFIVLFGAARAQPFTVTPEGPHLSSLGYAAVGSSDLALIVGTTYPLGAEGRGYSVGRLDGEDGEATLYVDFAPQQRGETVARVPELAQELATVRRPESVQKTVVIDPGHGGYDPGAVSDYVTEKDLVLSVGLLLREKLEARGVRVEMTRDDDTFVELEDRASFAVPSRHNLFISLHANSTETAGAEGIETWVFGEPQDDSLIDLAVLENGGGEVGLERTAQAQQDAASIDGDLLREENLAYSTVLADAVQNDLVTLTGSENRGIKTNYFVVLRDARVPAVLAELGFVNHAEEGPKLADAAYREMLAEALADGVEAFLAPGGTLVGIEETPSN